MEYCPYGNLGEFLRDSRSRFNVENVALVSDISNEFGQKNLICIAWQIARGMAFLISRQVICSLRIFRLTVIVRNKFL